VISTNSGLRFIHPLYRGNAAQCKTQIESDKLQLPTAANILDLIYESRIQDPDSFYSQELNNLMATHSILGYTGCLFLPGRTYYQDRPRLNKDGTPIMDEDELEQILYAHPKEINGIHYSKDHSVRSIPESFKTARFKPEQLAEHKHLIGVFGSKELLEKFVSLARKYETRTLIDAIDNNHTVTGICSFNHSLKKGYSELCLFTTSHGKDEESHTIGIF
jgi:hypothetical protein